MHWQRVILSVSLCRSFVLKCFGEDIWEISLLCDIKNLFHCKMSGFFNVWKVVNYFCLRHVKSRFQKRLLTKTSKNVEKTPKWRHISFMCFSFSCTNLFRDSDCNDNKTEIVLETLSLKRHQSDFFFMLFKSIVVLTGDGWFICLLTCSCSFSVKLKDMIKLHNLFFRCTVN